MTTPYYERDGMAIYHGDAAEVLLDIPRVDLVLTSPPYNTLPPTGRTILERCVSIPGPRTNIFHKTPTRPTINPSGWGKQLARRGIYDKKAAGGGLA